MTQKLRFAIVRSMYRPDITGGLLDGAQTVLNAAGIPSDIFEVEGSLEIPAAVSLLIQHSKQPYDGYVVLGCILKGDTIHDEVIAYTIFPAIDEIARAHGVAIGNGILTVNTAQQAEERADKTRQDRGGEAARAALAIHKIKANLRADNPSAAVYKS
jgi:6,7-dimethyl-8-ribityllumazine synthase